MVLTTNITRLATVLINVSIFVPSRKCISAFCTQHLTPFFPANILFFHPSATCRTMRPIAWRIYIQATWKGYIYIYIYQYISIYTYKYACMYICVGLYSILTFVLVAVSNINMIWSIRLAIFMSNHF